MVYPVSAKNFSYGEVVCPCCALTPKHTLVVRLQALRDKLGFPLRVTSGTRCPDKNTAIGGAVTSRHLSGEAVDIAIRHLQPHQKWELIAGATAVGFHGIGIYRTHIHLDIRKEKVLWIHQK